ncbi:uncharacterized protein LOC107037247 [Diachasma alloeum]|uniref:Odorant binding protein 10 n=1 Tax=Diachasma alloeum TaxID=454923 RepID=A0A4E0RN86_9HYME|nr:uncharacterized protein LOC107037247 [Diachasma alloeum]THK32846.1 odorant binding protein 10 [Diachasma alloeum]
MQRENFKRQGTGIDMRIIVPCLALLSLVLFVRGDDKDPHGPIREKCKDQFGLSSEDLKEAMEDPNDVGCYLLCFFKDLSIMDDSGEFDPLAAMDAIEESAKDGARPVIFSCYDQEKKSATKDTCARALEVVLCFKKEAPELYKNLGLFHPLGQ